MKLNYYISSFIKVNFKWSKDMDTRLQVDKNSLGVVDRNGSVLNWLLKKKKKRKREKEKKFITFWVPLRENLKMKTWVQVVSWNVISEGRMKEWWKWIKRELGNNEQCSNWSSCLSVSLAFHIMDSDIVIWRKQREKQFFFSTSFILPLVESCSPGH